MSSLGPWNDRHCQRILWVQKFGCSPPDRKGLLDFVLESAFAMLLHHAPTQHPARAARAARQRIPPSIPPEQLASGSRRVSRQSCSPVDPAEYPARAAGQWVPPSIPPERIPPSIPPERIPPSIPPERLASGEYPARAARQWIPPSIPPSVPG